MKGFKKKLQKKKYLFIISTIPIYGLLLLLIVNNIGSECAFITSIIYFVIAGIFGVLFFLSGMDYVEENEREKILREKQIKLLYESTIKDSLTEIYNRSYIFEKLSEFKNTLLNRDIPVSLIMIDVDNFKQVNDFKGHFYGDYVLKNVASIMKNNVRASDIVGRYGGEEFIIIAPHTLEQDAFVVANHIREKVQLETSSEITISLGVTQIKDKDDIEKALIRADEAMYRSKHKGKNCVEVI